MKNVSRNAPCPCGSGKKYKKCCGSDKQSHLTGLTPGIRMKGGVCFDDNIAGFVPIVHTWDNIDCNGEPNEWRAAEVFQTEDEAMNYYKSKIRPDLQRLMTKIENELTDGTVIRRELE